MTVGPQILYVNNDCSRKKNDDDNDGDDDDDEYVMYFKKVEMLKIWYVSERCILKR